LLNSLYSSVSSDFRFKETPYVNFFTDPELSSSLYEYEILAYESEILAYESEILAYSRRHCVSKRTRMSKCDWVKVLNMYVIFFNNIEFT